MYRNPTRIIMGILKNRPALGGHDMELNRHSMYIYIFLNLMKTQEYVKLTVRIFMVHLQNMYNKTIIVSTKAILYLEHIFGFL